MKLTPEQRAFAEESAMKLKLVGADKEVRWIKRSVLYWDYKYPSQITSPEEDIERVRLLLRRHGLE